jgi:hypothetical protein
MQQQKQEKVELVLSTIEELNVKDKVEVLANVFISIGIDGINTEDKINKLNIADILLRDVENNGQTLANALARQGLLILTWLNKD